jgi:hypothetical protein
VTPHYEHALLLRQCFDFVFRSVCDGWTCLHHLLRPAPSIRFRNHCNASWGFWTLLLKPDSSFWMAFTFQDRSSAVECQLKITNVQCDQAPTRRQKMLKKNRDFIHEDRCQTIHELEYTVGISYGVSLKILSENLNMRCITSEFVPQLLTNYQKQRRVNVFWATRGR